MDKLALAVRRACFAKATGGLVIMPCLAAIVAAVILGTSLPNERLKSSAKFDLKVRG